MHPGNGNMEVLTSKNRMSATPFLSLYFREYVTSYCGNHNSLAEVENFGSYIITYCIFWIIISLLIIPICAHFKDQINRFWTTLQFWNFGSYIITYCIFWIIISLLIITICAHFKDQINRFWTTLQLSGYFHCVWNYFMQVFHLFIGLYYIIKECRQPNVPDKEMPQHLDVEELPETSPPLEEFVRSITEQLTTTFLNRRLITITENSIPGIL